VLLLLHRKTTTKERKKMENFTTKQIKDALIELYSMKTEEAMKAYQMAFEELNERLGDDAFDAFLDAYGL
jgi:translation initiation factor 2 alpha subunit (eIF-2alpha)